MGENGMTEVQKWRIGVEGRMSTLEQENKNQTDALGRIETAVGDLVSTVSIHHKQSEERMRLGRKKMNSISNRGWVNSALIVIVGVVLLYTAFGVTVAGSAGGLSVLLGLVIKIKQLL